MTAVLIALMVTALAGAGLVIACPARSGWCHFGGGMTAAAAVVAVVATLTGS